MTLAVGVRISAETAPGGVEGGRVSVLDADLMPKTVAQRSTAAIATVEPFTGDRTRR